MKELATAEGWTFPFLMDESQAVAREFHAACTPDFFLFDASGKLGPDSRKFLQGWMHRYVAFVKKVLAEERTAAPA